MCTLTQNKSQHADGVGAVIAVLSMEISGNDRCWERESQFSFKVLSEASELIPVKGLTSIVYGQQKLCQMPVKIHIWGFTKNSVTPVILTGVVHSTY